MNVAAAEAWELPDALLDALLLPPLAVPDEAGIAVAESDERAASGVKVAERPVTLEQTLGGVAESATKLTAAHYKCGEYVNAAIGTQH